MPLISRSRTRRIAAGLAIAASLVAGIGTTTAAAHPQSGVPYHHIRSNTLITECHPRVYNGGALSGLYFNQPDDVRSLYASEWVYFRPIATRWTSAGWVYERANWQRGLATRNGLQAVAAAYGPTLWTSENGSQAAYSAERLALAAGVQYWVGYEIHWSTMRYTHIEWTRQYAC